MLDRLDIPTLLISSGMTSLVLAVWMVHVSVNRKTYAGFSQWTVASVATFIGYTMTLFRGVWPDFLTIVVSNSCLILAMVLLDSGLVAFADGKRSARRDASTFLLFVAGFSYFTFVIPSMLIRVCILSAGVCLLSLCCATSVSRRLSKSASGGNSLLTFAFSALSILNAIRLIATLSGANPHVGLTIVGGWHNLAIVGSTTATVLMYTGLVAVNAQRIEQELINARNEIKTLKGLLPVCSSCKKIRNAQGNWTAFESHIATHSEARVSHGLCPDCEKTFFPNEEEEARAKA